MVFSSAFFIYAFLPIVIGIYYVIDKRLKNIFLFVASLVFYGWGEPEFIIILLLSILVNSSKQVTLYSTTLKIALKV